MLIGILLDQVAAAQIAEMGIALEADHVVAPVRLLRARVARRARLRVQLHVLLARALLGRDLELAAREAGEVFAVPARFADEAEGKGAVLADGEAVFRRRQGWGVGVVGLGGDGGGGGLGGTLAPLAGAVDGVAVGFEELLAFELDVAVHGFLGEGDLEEFAGFEGLV